MTHLGASLPSYIRDRRDRVAAALRLGDYVHDPLVPIVITDVDTSREHVVVVVGALASGTAMTVRYPAGRELDVTRLVPTTPAPLMRRRHLSLVHSAETGGATR